MADWDLIRRDYTPVVWGTVVRILKHRDDALDCCQEVFAEALQRSRRGPVDDWGAFLRWLATRRAIDSLRRRQRRLAIDGHAGDAVRLAVADAAAVEEGAAFQELVEIVRGELTSLPAAQAEAFWLVCVEERTYGEVAEQMGIEANAVGVLVHRARRHMRSKLHSLDPMRPE